MDRLLGSAVAARRHVLKVLNRSKRRPRLGRKVQAGTGPQQEKETSIPCLGRLRGCSYRRGRVEQQMGFRHGKLDTPIRRSAGGNLRGACDICVGGGP